MIWVIYVPSAGVTPRYTFVHVEKHQNGGNMLKDD